MKKRRKVVRSQYSVVSTHEGPFRGFRVFHGFDPTEAEPWTSVGVGSTQQVVQLNIGSGTDPSKITLAVQASDKVWVSQTNNFSLDVNLLTISGLSPTNDATVVVRYTGLTNAIAALHVMVLPWITNSIGIYEIEDQQSTNRWQVGAPSATNVINELNSVYAQACVYFKLADLTPTNLVERCSYDNGGDEPKIWMAGNGMIDECEITSTNLVRWLNIISSGTATWCVYFFRNSGMLDTWGWTQPNCSWSGVCMHANPPLWKDNPYPSLVTGHEVGHLLQLCTRNDDGKKHDQGTPPSGTSTLMRKEIDEKPQESRWMRHDDWWQANKKARGQ